MILYLDTSALVKKYISEHDSEIVINIMAEHESIAISYVGYAETQSSFYKKIREKNYSVSKLQQKITEFKKDWESFIIVNAGPNLNSIIDRIFQSHPLKGFDAIHLASALFLRDNLNTDVLFGSYDANLNKAAKNENLLSFPE